MSVLFTHAQFKAIDELRRDRHGDQDALQCHQIAVRQVLLEKIVDVAAHFPGVAVTMQEHIKAGLHRRVDIRVARNSLGVE